VSRICAELSKEFEEFRNRPLNHAEFVYVLADTA
jgi:transposase-like protein